MGIGTSMKETTKHYYKDPLLEVVSKDPEVNLRGVVIIGCPDSNDDKMRAGERVGTLLQAMGADGAIFSCNGLGNNHVDYAKSIEETESRGIPVIAMSTVPAKDMVTQNPYLERSVMCFYRSKDPTAANGDASYVLAEHTYERRDAVRALALLKQRMRRNESD